MRYTAATCDPDEFVNEKYALRQVLMSPPRQTELMIVMSTYGFRYKASCARQL